MSARYARAIVRFRWFVLAAWVAGTTAAVLLLPTIEDAQSGALGNLVPDDSRAVAAEERAAELFSFPVLTRVVVVQRDPDGFAPGVQTDAIERAAALTAGEIPRFRRSVPAGFPLVNGIAEPPLAREENTTALTYLLFDPDIGPQGQRGLAELLIEREMDPQRDAPVGVTGAAPAQGEQIGLIRKWLPLVELGTLLLVALAVGLHFRALLAPLITLATVAVSYLTASHVVAAIGSRAGLSVPQEVEPVIVVLIFGIVTDYAVFLLSRFRRRLAAGEGAREAAEGTTAEMAAIILTAGVAVMVGTASLLAAQLQFFRVFGPGVALAVGVGLLASLTFLPAALAAFGSAVFWPSRPGRDVPQSRADEDLAERERPVRSRTLRWVAAHPWPAALGCLLVLLAAASGVTHLQVGQTLIRGLPSGADSRVAYEAAAKGFTPGVISPTVVVVEGEGVAARRPALARLQEMLDRQPGVAAVLGPKQQPASDAFGAVLAAGGDAARYIVVFNSDPLGAAAIRNARRLDRRLPELLAVAGVGDVSAALSGDTAIAAEIVSETGRDLARIAPVTLVTVTLVLALFLRALVAPLYLVAASVLALAAALGLTVYVFQDLLGYSELTYYVPFVAAVLLVSLGSDYNVFLAGRVWQEARQRPIRDAVAVGGTRAARAITVAGIVLALSFALLALVPLRPFRELAFMMFAGLLLDAFVVRTILVPALLAIFGRASGWPGRALATRTAPSSAAS